MQDRWIIKVEKFNSYDDEGKKYSHNATISTEAVVGRGNSFAEAVNDLLEKLADLATDNEICPPMHR